MPCRGPAARWGGIRSGGSGGEIEATETYGLAAAFYAVHRERAPGNVSPSLPDTQGVFDIAHLLYGEAIFYELTEESQRGWMELLGIASRLYERTSLVLKRAIGEENHTQVHGHGTEQGVYFPHAGVRMSEDTATLLSGAMIERTILPAIREACRPFGGVFVHFCGFHRVFFHQLAAMPEVKAIDLGNPEKYETAWLFEQCARTGTVLYSRVTAEGGESWRRYIERLSGLVRSTGARVILRPGVFPEDRDQCQAMLDLWHERTC